MTRPVLKVRRSAKAEWRKRAEVACPAVPPKHRASVPVDSDGPYIVRIKTGFDRPWTAVTGVTRQMAEAEAEHYRSHGSTAWAEVAR